MFVLQSRIIRGMHQNQPKLSNFSLQKTKQKSKKAFFFKLAYISLKDKEITFYLKYTLFHCNELFGWVLHHNHCIQPSFSFLFVLQSHIIACMQLSTRNECDYLLGVQGMGLGKNFPKFSYITVTVKDQEITLYLNEVHAVHCKAHLGNYSNTILIRQTNVCSPEPHYLLHAPESTQTLQFSTKNEKIRK